jgi:GGDEF domain-containing protein
VTSFAIVLPGCPADEGRRLVQDVLAQLKAYGGPSVSMGFAIAEAGTWMPRDLLAAADEELYRAKRAAHDSKARADRRRESRQARRRRETVSPAPH